ncbi:hypothetical protein PTKIN_Ptkin02bG0208900 [Pterospermum kingtungense]
MQASAAMDDRFSALSEQLAYRILSFLEIEDLRQLMLVSRKCMSLCVSVPCLAVDNRNFTHNLISRQRFNQFVGNFLALRANSGTKSREVTFVWSFQGTRSDQKKKRKKGDRIPDPEEHLVAQWLKELSSGGAEKLSISMVRQEGWPNFFPCHVLWSKSLKDLTFCSNGHVMEFPATFGKLYPLNIESLTLQSAQISVKFSSLAPAISQLHSLVSLSLYDCSGLKFICIESSSLKQLKIINEKPVDLRSLMVIAPKLEKFMLTWYPSDLGQTSFQINCSALQDFVWYGYPVPLHSPKGKQSHLQSAALYFTIPPGSDFSKYNVKYLLPMLESSAKFLRLNFETIEIVFKPSHFTAQLDALRNLSIDYCVLTDEQIPMIASFLKKICCLETFYLTSANLKVAAPHQGFRFNVEYWENQELKFIDNLRKAAVEVQGVEGNDMELVKYMLKNARGLEYLTIVCAPSLVSDIEESLTAYMNEAFTKFNFCLKPEIVGV